MKRLILASVFASTAAALVGAQTEKLDYAMLGRIRDEGMGRSQVMDHISWLSDVYGPRLTGSPGMQQASEWAMKKFTEWGLANAHQERWIFGKGWSLVRFSAHLVEPQIQPIIGFPHEWSSATKGTVTGEVVRVQISNEADFARYRGKLAGKIVLSQPARQVRMLEGPIILRMTDKDLAEAETTPVPAAGDGRGGGRGGQAAAAFRQKVADFYVSEGVVALFDRGSDSDMAAGGSDLSWQQQHTDGGTIFPAGSGARDENAGKAVPAITLAVEHYNRMVRVLDKGIPVKVELNVDAKFYDESTPNGFTPSPIFPAPICVRNRDARRAFRLASIFDRRHRQRAGSGAMMEAMRILKAVGASRAARPDRSGAAKNRLLGSRAVRDHLADVETMALKPEQGKLAAYFNSKRQRQDPRHLAAGQHGGAADRRVVDGAAPRSRRHDDRTAVGRVNGSRVVRQRRDSGVPVHGRSARVQRAHAPLEHGHVRPRPARRHDPAGDGHRRVRLQRGDARRSSPRRARAQKGRGQRTNSIGN